MPRVIHFEIPTENPEKTIAFYEQAFGWKTRKWEGPQDYWLVCTGEHDGGGIDGAIMRKTDAYGVRNTIGVEDIDEALRKIEEAGGKVILPSSPIEGVGDWALCEDPDGNFFAVMQPHEIVHCKG
ncbi:MAG: VOC family protein [Armatimonadota bacterium]